MAIGDSVCGVVLGRVLALVLDPMTPQEGRGARKALEMAQKKARGYWDREESDYELDACQLLDEAITEFLAALAPTDPQPSGERCVTCGEHHGGHCPSTVTVADPEVEPEPVASQAMPDEVPNEAVDDGETLVWDAFEDVSGEPVAWTWRELGKGEWRYSATLPPAAVFEGWDSIHETFPLYTRSSEPGAAREALAEIDALPISGLDLHSYMGKIHGIIAALASQPAATRGKPVKKYPLPGGNKRSYPQTRLPVGEERRHLLMDEDSAATEERGERSPTQDLRELVGNTVAAAFIEGVTKGGEWRGDLDAYDGTVQINRQILALDSRLAPASPEGEKSDVHSP